jgi:hypothetical protein
MSGLLLQVYGITMGSFKGKRSSAGGADVATLAAAQNVPAEGDNKKS